MSNPKHFVFRVSWGHGDEYLAGGQKWTADKSAADLMDQDTAEITAHDWTDYFKRRGGAFSAFVGTMKEAGQ